MDESGQGEVVFFERLAGPDPLPESLRENKFNDRTPPKSDTSGDRLNSQKAAAAYIEKDPKTLRTWIANGWVPEHRHEGKGRPWYFKSELDRAQPGVPFDSTLKSKK